MPTKFIWKVERVRPLVTFAHWITVFPVEYAKRVFTKGKSRTILPAVALSIFYETYRETAAKMENGSCEDPESEFRSLILNSTQCISELSHTRAEIDSIYWTRIFQLNISGSVNLPNRLARI